MTQKIIPVGNEDFARVRRGNMYYVDKTGLIKELFSISRDVTLFTRPRRFGKTLNMSMLQCFFEIGTDKSLFDGLEISKDTELCDKHMGQYPVIFITLKDVVGANFDAACERLRRVFKKESKRLNFLAQSKKLDSSDLESYRALRNGTLPLEDALDTLSELLYTHYGKKVVILIDEYDVPLSRAMKKGYYDDMVELIRVMFSSALKTSSQFMEFAVLTGCLRITKESIFTGLNHFTVNSIADDMFDEWFGFTDNEVREMLKYYGFEDRYDTTKEWYDGYRFGAQDVYNPWDVTSWCSDLLKNNAAKPVDYWANTSDNDIIKEFAEKGDDEVRKQLGELVDGMSITKKIDMNLTYPEIHEDIDNLWIMLYYSGYLTKCGVTAEGDFELKIPNKELNQIYKNSITNWFEKRTIENSEDIKELIEAFVSGDVDKIVYKLNVIMSDTISFFDYKEGFYHGLLLGMLKSNDRWDVKSNREAGDGRFDIAVKAKIKYRLDIGFIIEVKQTSTKSSLEAMAQEALGQIEEKKYEEYFAKNDRSKIAKYGIAFSGKDCCVIKKMPTASNGIIK